MLRAAALSLLILCSLAIVLPVTYTLAQENGQPAAVSSRRNKRVRRHSRAWWRRYRARLARRRAEAERQKALASWDINPNGVPGVTATEQISANAFAATGGIYSDPRGQFSLTLPRGWSNRPVMAGSEMKFRVYGADGRAVGTASLSVAATAAANSTTTMPVKTRRQMLAGVPFSDLRRIVIDKMIATGGWVVNDFSREIGGRQVFLVVAQTPASADGRNPQQSWQFYFAEIDGRIYNLATNAPEEFADRLAQEAEQALASFRSTRAPTEAASSQR